MKLRSFNGPGNVSYHISGICIFMACRLKYGVHEINARLTRTCALLLHTVSRGSEPYPPVDYHIPLGSRKSSAIQPATRPQINPVMYTIPNTAHLRFL